MSVRECVCERESVCDRRITSRRREENESLFGGGEGSLTESRKRKGNLVISVEIVRVIW